MQCGRCGLSIKNSGTTCPGCGAHLVVASAEEFERDYYALFDLNPQMSYSEIRARLDQAARLWANRSSGAPKMEQRHEAERMLQFLSEAEAILLKPATRMTYDEKWRQRQTGTLYSTGKQPIVTSMNGRPTAQSASREWDGEVPQTESDSKATFPGYRSETPVPFAREESSKESLQEIDSGVKSNWLCWTTLRGTVIHLDPMYTIPPPISWVRVILAIVLFPVMASIALSIFAFYLAMQIMHPRLSRSMDITNLLILLFTLHRTGAQQHQVPTRDLRVRSSDGNEHFVRLTGQLVAGSVNVGDDVTFSGFSSGGTLKARQGITHRTRSIIKVRT